MKSLTLPVVFAADENYLVPAYVAAFSLVQNTRPETELVFYFMIPAGLPEAGRRLLSSLGCPGRCRVEWIEMREQFENAKMQISYITPATYYRLLLPELLPQWGRCLYLDADLVVEEDLTGLYLSLPEDSYLAGVVAGNPALPGLKGPARARHAALLGLENLDGYINAGVLVCNLEKMRRDDLVPRFLERVAQNYPYQDQDILNALCDGGIAHAPRKYNVCPLNGPDTLPPGLLSREEEARVRAAYRDPAVVHYAQPQKPWLSRRFPMAEHWWRYCDAADPAIRREFLAPYIRRNRWRAPVIRLKHSRPVMGSWQALKRGRQLLRGEGGGK